MNCPLCRKAAKAPYTPFCSKRCSDLDLGKWLRGDYAVPVVEEDDAPDNEEDPAQRTE
ncbi:MAG: DNA gyrase inhibitor YacG [Rickettsiales bacterium]|jgi:endogenous inhibitor of DNA gyrase (YacG/DUF329 family)|nr:DNA gyrase inhibitor YacG [Rickettsiales bacterium]